MLLTIPRCRTEFGKSAFSHSAPSVGNTIAHEIRSFFSLASFNRRSKSHLLIQPYHPISHVPSIDIAGNWRHTLIHSLYCDFCIIYYYLHCWSFSFNISNVLDLRTHFYDINSVFSHSIDYLLTHRIHCCTVKKKKITVNTVKHGAKFEC